MSTAWTKPRIWQVGEQANATLLNTHVRDNFEKLDQHGHGSGSGSGARELGPLVYITFVDAAAPGAPGGTLTAIFSTTSTLGYRPGTGAAVYLIAETHTHGY